MWILPRLKMAQGWPYRPPCRVWWGLLFERVDSSYSKTEASIVKGEGEIILKLFNMVAKELGPTFLENGIMIEGHAFQNFVSRNSEDLKAACISIHLNDEKTDFAGLLEMNWENQQVFLQVTSEETG